MAGVTLALGGYESYPSVSNTSIFPRYTHTQSLNHNSALSHLTTRMYENKQVAQRNEEHRQISGPDKMTGKSVGQVILEIFPPSGFFSVPLIVTDTKPSEADLRFCGAPQQPAAPYLVPSTASSVCSVIFTYL